MNKDRKTINPQVTIGIPFKNNEVEIEQAILSVIHQSNSDWELLLIDDNSSDNSVAIARKYVDGKKIKLLVDHINKGLPGRLNQMIDLATGKYFCRMDADDVMHPDRIKIQVNILNRNHQIDVTGSAAVLINRENEILGLRRSPHIPDRLLTVVKQGVFIHPTVMGRTSWFRNNKYRKKFVLTEDLELWTRTFKSSKFYISDIPLLFYRLPSTNNLKKYYITTVNSCRLVKQYVDSKFWFDKWTLMIYFYTKLLCAFLVNLVGLEHLWVKKLGIQMDENQYEEYKISLAKAIEL